MRTTSASLKIEPVQVPLYITPEGDVRVAGTRVLLDIVIGAFNMGESPEDIIRSFTTLKLEDVYAVIAYYLQHREEVDAYMQRRREEGEVLRKEIEALFPPEGIRERLLSRLPK